MRPAVFHGWPHIFLGRTLFGIYLFTVRALVDAFLQGRNLVEELLDVQVWVLLLGLN